jgi:multiple sugar transport system permease protein
MRMPSRSIDHVVDAQRRGRPAVVSGLTAAVGPGGDARLVHLQRAERRGTREHTPWTIGLAVVVLSALVPVLWILALSLKSAATIGDGRLIPAELTLGNYESLFEGGFDSPFVRPLINSLAIALIATTIAVVIASFAAYAIARMRFRGKFAVLALALAIAMFPPISVVGPLFDMWRALGIYDTYSGS